MYIYIYMHAITIVEQTGYEFKGEQEGGHRMVWREKVEENVLITL